MTVFETAALGEKGVSFGEPVTASNDATPVVHVEDLRKRFRRNDGTVVPAVDGVSFDLHAGEIMVLLGPSGCGKTTLLRCIAGLERPDSGRIAVEGRTVFSSDGGIDVSAERRRLSMVFQSYALWPHMNVFQNIAYPLRSLPRAERPSKAAVAERVDEIMEIVGIPGLQKQHPNAISGGQQQRVALCRALIAGSRLVLFDEPLSNVDAQVREQLRLELLLMQRRLHFAALFVTHDRQEAMALANWIAVLDTGSIAQLGSPAEIYNAPNSRYVANFIGPTNELEVKLVSVTNRMEAIGQADDCTLHGRVISEGHGLGPAVAVWRPERGRVALDEPTSINRWHGYIEQSSFYGAHTEYVVRISNRIIRVFMTGSEAIPSGTWAWVSVDVSDVMFLPVGRAASGGASGDESLLDLSPERELHGS